MMSKLHSLSNKNKKIYRETPSNWGLKLKSNFICDPLICMNLISQATLSNEVIAFIDTCTIIKISKIRHNVKLIKMIAREYDYLIFTAEVIKELTSETVDEFGTVIITSNWTTEEEEFIKSLKREGAKLLYLNENTLVNHILNTAVTHELVHKRTKNLLWLLSNLDGNKLNIISKTDAKFQKELMPNSYKGSNYLLDLIVYLKTKKSSGDSLAELLIVILIHSWLNNNMPFIHFISDDRKADGLLQIVHDFQTNLRRRKYLNETKFMGRIESISFVKKAVDSKLITDDNEIVEYCKPYLNEVGYVVTVTGGRYINKERLTLPKEMFLVYMNDIAIQVHATSNIIQVLKKVEWDID